MFFTVEWNGLVKLLFFPPFFSQLWNFHWAFTAHIKHHLRSQRDSLTLEFFIAACDMRCPTFQINQQAPLTAPFLSLRSIYSKPQLTALSIRSVLRYNQPLADFSPVIPFSPHAPSALKVPLTHTHISAVCCIWRDFISPAETRLKTSIPLCKAQGMVRSIQPKMFSLTTHTSAFVIHTHSGFKIPFSWKLRKCTPVLTNAVGCLQNT